MNNNKAENSPSGANTKSREPQAKVAFLNAAQKNRLNCRAVAVLPKVVSCFLQLNPGLNLGNRSFGENIV